MLYKQDQEQIYQYQIQQYQIQSKILQVQEQQQYKIQKLEPYPYNQQIQQNDQYIYQINNNELISDGYGQKVNTYIKTISNELNLIPIPDDIKHKANEIYLKMKIPVKRNNPRRKMIFCCICYAYREMQLPHNPRKIAKMMGLNTNKIQNAFSQFSYTITKYKPVKYRQKAVDHIPLFYQFTGLAHGEEQYIINIANEIFHKNEDLLYEDPVCVAGSIIIYYMQFRGLPENKAIPKEIGVTEATVKKILKLISLAHNL